MNLTRASKELFRRTPDESFSSLGVLLQHTRWQKQEALEAWQPPRAVSGQAGESDLLMLDAGNDGTFTISATGLGNNLSYTVLDGKGTRVVSGIMNGEKEKVTVPSLRPGMYFVRISNGEKEYVQKVIVQNTH